MLKGKFLKRGASNMKIEILPSLLAADFGRLADEIARAEDAGADELHLDIMDPHFVPNMSFGPDVVALSRRVSPGLRRHVHLMMSRPDLYIEKFVKAGAQTIQIHVEADVDVHDTLADIRSRGVTAALVLNPETPFSRIVPYLGEADEFLVMTVHPGYGGQSFIHECLGKITELRKALDSLGRTETGIMIDGGANFETSALAVEAGANMVVAGSYLYRQSDMKGEIARLRSSLEAILRSRSA